MKTCTTAVRQPSPRELAPADPDVELCADDEYLGEIDAEWQAGQLADRIQEICGPIEAWAEPAELDEIERLLADRRLHGWRDDDGWLEQQHAWLRVRELKKVRAEVVYGISTDDQRVVQELDGLIATYARIENGWDVDTTTVARARRYSVHACRRARREHERRAHERALVLARNVTVIRPVFALGSMPRRPAMRAPRARVHRAAAATKTATGDPDPEPDSRRRASSSGGAS